MKLYCFLLIIILFLIFYDNNLYEGNDHEYDINEDSTAEYQSGESSEGYYDILGFLPDTLIPDKLKDATSVSNTSELNCERFDNKDCNEGMSPNNYNWDYDIIENISDKKKKCMDCFKCKTNYAFIDEYYALICDAISGCLDNTEEYKSDFLPYMYAYKNTNWNTCDNTESINDTQGLTCGVLKDSTLIDTILVSQIPRTATCYANIGTLKLEGSAGELLGL